MPQLVPLSPSLEAEGIFMETLAERMPTLQKPEIDNELRIRTDTTTWLAETLHGSMRTSFEFTFDGQELRGEDGGSIDEIFDESIAEARAMTEWQPNMLFELRRRLIERDELNDMYDMLSGDKPNTMIVVSDFPPELMDSKEDVGGYNVSRQQTMLRVITLEQDGKLRITSQSLDHSNREALEAIFSNLDEPFEEGELLGQRIHREMTPEQQAELTSNLTGVYDNSLSEQKGGHWHAGISQKPDHNMLNTYDFVLQQPDLIDLFTKAKLDNPTRAEKMRYKIAATAEARHQRLLRQLNQSDTMPGTSSYYSLVNANMITSLANSRSLIYEMDKEGARATSQGKVYSGCGNTISSDDLNGISSNDALGNLGYGNKSGSRDKYGSLTFACPKGHSNTRPRNQLIDKCKTCGTSVKC